MSSTAVATSGVPVQVPSAPPVVAPVPASASVAAASEKTVQTPSVSGNAAEVDMTPEQLKAAALTQQRRNLARIAQVNRTTVIACSIAAVCVAGALTGVIVALLVKPQTKGKASK